MIKINLLNNSSGEPCLFELLFPLTDYIPEKYFKSYSEQAELYFFIDLLTENYLFSKNKKDFYESPAFDLFFDCSYNGIPFEMCRGDYGEIYFSVDKIHISYIGEIALHLKTLIEKQQKP